MNKRLDGITVAVPESRFRDEFTLLFERTGARVRLCPLMTESVLEDRSGIGAFIDLAISSRLDYMIFFTGIGTNLILEEAERIARRTDLLEALSKINVVSRGSKSTAALRKAGIRIDVIPQAATTEGLIEVLGSRDLQGKHIAVQLYGTPNPKLCTSLESRGATVFPISVYSYAPASEPHEIKAFIHDIIEEHVQVIAFTSAPQVHTLFDCAAGFGVATALRHSLMRHVHVASIGEVTTRALEAYDVRPQIVPDEPRMGPMVKAICTTLSS